MRTKTTRTLTAIFGALAAAATATMLASASSQKFYADDPVWMERDTQDASGMKPLEPSLFVDLTYNVIKGSGVVNPRPREEREHGGRGARLQLVHQSRRATSDHAR